MSNIIVLRGISEEIKNDFLNLPNKIYEKESCPQDYKTEQQILNGTHVLIKDIQVMPFVAYMQFGAKLVEMSRCLVTFYENDTKAYLGYFESIDNTEICKELFKEIEKYAKENGKIALVGPVDASFWIRYRFKYKSDYIFEDTFTSEPYNKDYYVKIWQECGFNIDNVYKSNMYRHVQKEDSSEKHVKRLNEMLAKGYEIKTSSFRTFNKDLVEIHRLITKLYSSFPLYKDISLNQFKKLFGYLKYILNYSMVKLVYKDGQVVAFAVNLPDYGTLSNGKVTLMKLLKILKIRKHPKRYILLYMGVDGAHLGLGSALAEDIKNELYRQGCASIGALIHEGKATNNYYKNLIVGSSSYVTLSKEM